MRPADCPVRVPGVEIHVVEDGCVVFAPAADEVHFLNATAQRVLELCDGTRAAAEMQGEFGEADAVGFDVQAGILDQFERAGLIVAARPEGPASPGSEDA